MDDRPAAGALVVESARGDFDVFLSPDGRDKPVLERIAEKLKRAWSRGSTSGA